MYITIDNYKINYIDEGSGDAIVLLHGWGANLNCFFNLTNQLKSKYRVVALDLPGFGESEKLKRSFSVDDYADIVEKFIGCFFKNREVVLIGHSYGGRIILKLNSRKELPFTINKNVLIDAAGLKDKKDFKTKIKIFSFKICKNIIKILPISQIKKEYIISTLKGKFGSADYKASDKIMQDTLIKSVNEDLSVYTNNMKETLLIWGDKDMATPLWMAKKFEKEIKNAGLVILNGGHFSFIDDPYTFAKVIASYFKL